MDQRNTPTYVGKTAGFYWEILSKSKIETVGNMNQLYQRTGADLVPVNLGGGGGMSADALEIDDDGMLAVDTDKSGGVNLTINDGILEAE